MGVIAGALVLVTAAAGIYFTRARETEKLETAKAVAIAQAERFERPYSRTLGPDSAPVTLVEFFDPECEACRAVHPHIKELFQRYRGKVRLVLRYMPLHGNSVYAATALEAAGEQGLYWELLDSLFENQPAWGDHHAPKPELIPGYAAAVGLDMERFAADLKNPAFAERIDQDHRDGRALGVRGTPTFFVNTRPLVRLSLDDLVAMIDEELAR